MSRLRSYAPGWIKRLVWDWKSMNASIEPAKCPHSLLECLGTLLDSNAGVLDLGCGPGNLRAALRYRGWKGHYIGVDVSARSIDAARQSQDNNAQWHVSRIETFPIPNEKVSTICLSESIYYVQIKLIPSLIARCRQCLVPGGHVVIRIWHADLHREYVTLLRRLGAHCEPPIYILAKQ